VPVNHQLLVVNLATLVDAVFLCWARSQDDWVGTMMAALQGAKDKAQAPSAVVAA
jgi:protein Mpv17